MTYLEARDSGRPFNRRKYIDGWYIRDTRRNVDYAQRDLSQRFWTEEDLEATDWWTTLDSLNESLDSFINEGEL